MKTQSTYAIFCEVIIIVLLIAACFITYKIFDYHAGKINFTPDHSHYINNNIIIWAVEGNFHPFIRMTSNGPTGISLEFLELIGHKTGLKLFSHSEPCQLIKCLDLLKNGDVSLVTSVKATPEREVNADFTIPYISVKSVIVSNVTEFKTLAVGKGFAVVPYLRNTYPNVALIEVPDDERGMLLLLSGSVDGVVTDELAEKSFKERYHYNHSVTPIDFRYDLSFAVRKGNSMLVLILNRAIESITPEEREKILSNVKVKP